jgi:D-sedoheptulose 7-phosphate isomerase
MELIKDYLAEVIEAVNAVNLDDVQQALDRLEQAYHEGQMVCMIGNGGSAAAASHFAEDLAKGALHDDEPKRFQVLSLADNTAYITAVANDIGYEHVFSFQLRQFAKKGDVLVAVSGSGNSPNIIKAVEYARAKGIFVISFTGFDGGQLKPLSDCNVHVPIKDMCKTEAVHAVLMHLIADMLLLRFGGLSKTAV